MTNCKDIHSRYVLRAMEDHCLNGDAYRSGKADSAGCSIRGYHGFIVTELIKMPQLEPLIGISNCGMSLGTNLLELSSERHFNSIF